VLGVILAAPAMSASGPPVNDDYLNSLEINQHGHPLNKLSTLKDTPNTLLASTQRNIFDPCGQNDCPGGPREQTACRGVHYGKTIWYDFYPQSDGNVRIRTAGFNNVISLYQFNDNPRSRFYLLPNKRTRQCVHQSSFPSEELDAQVLKGRSYTIQIGGVKGAGGPMQFLFDYFVPPPGRLQADATLKASATSTGISLLGLSVASTRGAQVSVDCGRFCRSETKIIAGSSASFADLAGVQLPAGAKLIIRVTAPHNIGVYIEYDIVKGNFVKITRCTEPGSRKPLTSCK
jgi:hypothetical protein